MRFYSEGGQDQFVFENFFKGRRGGVFVDVGAHDGERFSNSLFFEQTMGWRGLCVEPLTAAYSRLIARRRCVCEQICVVPCDDFGLSVESSSAERLSPVPLGTLSSLLEKHCLLHVDYCSINTGGGEREVVSPLDLSRFDIKVFTIHNDDDPELVRIMANKGYEIIGKLGKDCVFKRRDVKRLPRTTVVCAVWHRDPDREGLLQGHAENLSRQTVPIESVYVFDGADQPARSVPGRKVVVGEALSIYQAWNVALALVDTPWVMNLNLDDRLAPDAIERLEAELLQSGAALVGGEWRICYSQESTDAVTPCFPAERLPYLSDWPPKPGTVTRLGSGTGERGTFGPATLWRMDAHVGAPRYPWRFPEGTPFKVAGDAAWWAILTGYLKMKARRLEMVIGNYHSRPSSQAEFRGSDDEISLMNELGISLT